MTAKRLISCPCVRHSVDSVSFVLGLDRYPNICTGWITGLFHYQAGYREMVKKKAKKPSEEFKLTASTQRAHMKSHGKLVLKPLSYLTMHSRDDLTAVTFLRVLREFASRTVSLL